MKEQIQSILADTNIPIEDRIAHVDEIYAQAVKVAANANQQDEKYATLLSDYAEFLYNYAHYSEAIQVYLRQIALSINLYGKDHPKTADSYNDIGKVFFNQGEYDKALEYFQKALIIRENKYGLNNQDTAISYNNIGLVYDKQGDYGRALEFYYKALEKHEQVLGKDHPNTAKIYNNIGTVYYSKGAYAKALEYLLKAFDITKRIFGQNSPDAASIINNIGYVYEAQGNNEIALEHYLKALNILSIDLGNNHPDTATSYFKIGLIYESQGALYKALLYYEQALNIREQVLGNRHPDTATSYNRIGEVYQKLGDFDKALTYFEDALEIRIKVLGENHLDTAESYNNLGAILFRKGEYQSSLEYYNKAQIIYKSKYGENDPKTAVIYNNIGEVYSNLGNLEKAHEYYSKSIPIIEEKLGVESTDFVSSRDNIQDQNYLRIINDVTECTAALNDAFAFQKAMLTLADNLRKMFMSEYCAIGIVDGDEAEDCIVSLERHEDENKRKLQFEYLESFRIVNTSNKNLLLCRALENYSQDIITFNQQVLKESETYSHFQKYVLKSGKTINNTVIPLRDEHKQNIGYLQFLNTTEKIDFNIISPLLKTFLGLTNTILHKSIEHKKVTREKDSDFYERIQSAKGANDLVNIIMRYLSNEFNAAIVSFRIPIANAPEADLSHFYLRGCYVNEQIQNCEEIKKHYFKNRVLVPKEKIGGYKHMRWAHKDIIIYDTQKNNQFYKRFDLYLHEKSILIPIFRNNTTKRPQIKQLYGSFHLKFIKPFTPGIPSDNSTELISHMRFERELDEAKKRLEYLSEQITLLFNSYVLRFENESLQTFQNELKNSSFVKIQDFDEQCATIIKKTVRAKACSIYRYDKSTEQLTLSATTARTIRFRETNENLNANSNKDKCTISISSNNNIITRAFRVKRPIYIYDIRNSKSHQSPFIENVNRTASRSNLTAMVVPILKKNGECSGVVLLIGKNDPKRLISTSYWEHDISHIEFIVSTLTRISESDNERMTFLSQLSHELLSPVSELVYENDLIVDLVERFPDSISKQQLISKLQENIDKCMLLKYIITDTEFRYATSGRRMDYNIVKQERPQDPLLEAIRLLENEAYAKGITIEPYISIMPPMYFDNERMTQVFLNLLKNAIRYSDSNTAIDIFYKYNNGFHEIIFTNFGIGVKEEEKESIFELFYRGKEAKTKSDRGTGIGLYIVRDIMRAHGGNCFVRRLKDPTEFVITIPNKI